MNGTAVSGIFDRIEFYGIAYSVTDVPYILLNHLKRFSV